MVRSTTTKQKREPTPMRKMLVAIPEDVYKALKHHAVDTDQQMREVVTEALRHYLGLKGNEKEKKR